MPLHIVSKQDGNKAAVKYCLIAPGLAGPVVSTQEGSLVETF